MNKPRILIFSTAYFPHVGGAEVAIKEITDRLGSVFLFELVTARMDPRLPRTERVGEVLVHRIGSGKYPWLDKLRLAFGGARFAARLGSFAAVWGMMASFAGLAAASYKKTRPTTPFLLTLQEGDSLGHIYLRALPIWPWFRAIFRRANHIQAISHYLEAWGRRRGARCPIDVVPNGVDMQKFILSDEQLRVKYRERLRSELSIASDATIIFSASRLVPKNGLADLLRALAYLPETVHVVIAGSGVLYNSLTDLASRHRLESRVHFLGAVEQAGLPAIAWGSDIFCRPSLSEGLGNAFLEAMAARLPVIATPVGGIPDFLQDGVTGWFCRVNDPQSIAAKTRYIMDIKNRLVILGAVERASMRVAGQYSWETIATNMKKIFSRLCAS